MNWTITKEDAALVGQIVDRVAQRCEWLDRSGLAMDLIATHANGCPMDFAALVSASDHDLYHDISGIYAHLNRETGAIDNGFRPRYAKRAAAKGDKS